MSRDTAAALIRVVVARVPNALPAASGHIARTGCRSWRAASAKRSPLVRQAPASAAMATSSGSGQPVIAFTRGHSPYALEGSGTAIAAPSRDGSLDRFGAQASASAYSVALRVATAASATIAGPTLSAAAAVVCEPAL
jgi:hypothetical protein